MKNWVEEYKRLTLKTWWVSLLGAILAFGLVSIDFAYFSWVLYEIAPESPSIWWPVQSEFAVLTPVLAAIVFRIWTVWTKKRYSAVFLSTLAVFVISGWYFGYELYQSGPKTFTTDDGMTFTAYDISRGSRTQLVFFGYAFFGGMRFVVTAIVAYIRSLSRLN